MMKADNLAVLAASATHAEPNRQTRGKRCLDSQLDARWLVHHLQHDQFCACSLGRVGQGMEGVADLSRRRDFGRINHCGSSRHRHHMRQGRGYDYLVCSGSLAGREGRFNSALDDLFGAVGETGILEHQTRSGIGVGGHNFRACLDIVRVDIDKNVIIFERCRTTPCSRIHRRAAALEFRAGGTVQHNDVTCCEALFQIGIGHGELPNIALA